MAEQHKVKRQGHAFAEHSMNASDRALEQLYRLAERQPTEYAREQVATIALLAARHRAAQLVRQKDEHLA